MSDKLQQAIQATRAGDQKNAQFLLTEAIQEEPNNPQSWYLLSLLVDDNEKKQTYLSKVLAIDPEHEKAQQHLATVTETAVLAPETSETPPVVISSGSADLAAQDAGQSLPDWMADDLPPMAEETEEVVAETAVVTEEPLPDWLEESVADDWDQAETAVVETTTTQPDEKEDKQAIKKASEEKKESAAPEKKPSSPQKSSETKLNYMLIALIIIAVIVFLVMAYMIFNMMA